MSKAWRKLQMQLVLFSPHSATAPFVGYGTDTRIVFERGHAHLRIQRAVAQSNGLRENDLPSSHQLPPSDEPRMIAFQRGRLPADAVPFVAVKDRTIGVWAARFQVA